MLLKPLFVFMSMLYHGGQLSAFETSLLQVKSEEISESVYVKSLMESIDKVEPSTKDVAILSFSEFGQTKRSVDEMFRLIRKSIPDTFVVIAPHSRDILRYHNLRKSSVTIIVSDISDPVSKIICGKSIKDLMRHSLR